MTKKIECSICAKKTSSFVDTIEKRYFHGWGKVCFECYDLLCIKDYATLDNKVVIKVKTALADKALPRQGEGVILK